MRIELRLFGPFRDVVGEKALTYELPDGTTVDDAMHELVAEFPELESRLLDDGGDVSESVTVTKNKRDLNLLTDEERELSNGDVVRISPPITGG